jgi:hypothetical protein
MGAARDFIQKLKDKGKSEEEIETLLKNEWFFNKYHGVVASKVWTYQQYSKDADNRTILYNSLLYALKNKPSKVETKSAKPTLQQYWKFDIKLGMWGKSEDYQEMRKLNRKKNKKEIIPKKTVDNNRES